MMNPMRDLAVPPELDTLLKNVKDFKPVHTPRLNVQEEHSRPVPQNESADLPDNVDEFLFSKFVAENFIDRNKWGVLSTALRHPLTRNTTGRDEQVAVELNRMILRVMLDKNLSASQIKLFVDFLINKILWNYQIRDEALCQIASLTWNNNDKANKKRLWVLLSSCLSCIIPSSSFYNYLLKYVSDHASDGYEALLQQKLLSMPRNQSPEEKRLFPPSILEWKSNDSHAPMAVKIHLPNDTTALIEVNSWTTAEDAANRAMESIMGGSKQGWSLVLVSDNKRMTEISGHDYLFDLFSRMELFPELQTPPDEFLSYGTGANEKPNFNSAQSSYADRPSRTEPKEVPVDVPEARPSHDRSYSGGVNSNFSFGPPNIRIPSNLHGPGGLGNQHVDPETGGLASRIKGGGKMMNPMGMGTMMQQPQMMPMMQQQPMMPMQPMNMGMMQQPMMQQPMMQQPMMQQPMMQQPMMQQPMMQQPVYQPMMQQMPGSIGMMSAAMDSSGQQTTIQQQMQTLMKQQEEMRQTMEKESKRRDEEDRDRWRRSERRHRRDSSSEDRHRRRERRDSSGEDYRRERRRSSEKDKKRSSYKENRGWKPTEQGSWKSKESTASVKTRTPIKADRKSDHSDSDEEPAKLPEAGQGTVRMSFNEKRKFFLNKANAGNKPPPLQRPAKKPISLPKEEETVPNHTPEDTYDDVKAQPKPKPQPQPLKKAPVKEKDDPHQQAMALLNIKKADEELTLLSRQRREAAGRKTSQESKPIAPEPKPEPVRMNNTRPKLTPARMTPVNRSLRKPPEDPPKIEMSDSSDSSEEGVSVSPIEMALLAKQQSQRQQENLYQERPPPLELEIPKEEEREVSPPLPPPLTDPEDQPSPFQGVPPDQGIRTVQHFLPNQAPLAYANVTWRLYVRKEFFLSGEHIKDEETARYCFRQIIRESRNQNPRIAPAERNAMVKREQTMKGKKVESSEVKSTVEQCMEKWPVYFTRIFKMKVIDSIGLPQPVIQASALGVGQTGIHFIVMNGASQWQIQSYQFDAIDQVKERNKNISISINGNIVIIACRKSLELGRTIRPYMIEKSPRTVVGSPMVYQREVSEDSMLDMEQEKQEDLYEVLPPPPGKRLTLVQYGQQYFKKKKEVDKALQHSKASLSRTLHEISDQDQAAASLKCFKLIQQYMGDIPLKATTIEALVREFIGTCHRHRGIIVDEVCIYLAKQTTNNSKHESLVAGWRLFAMFLAFFRCSDLLLRFLLAHLHHVADNGEDISRNSATVCLVNLQHTLDYGGRRHQPCGIEIRDFARGRAAFEQIFHLPGSTSQYQVVLDVVKHFCSMLGVKSEEEMKEFGVFKILMDSNSIMQDIIPQRRNIYLMDIVSEVVKEKLKYMLTFQRVVWKRQINYENDRLVQMLFHQVISEYTDGKFLTYEELSENSTPAQIAQLSRMAALISIGYGESGLPTPAHIRNTIPRKVFGIQSEFAWKESVQKEFTSVQQMPPTVARSEVLGILSDKPMFGSTFFNVEISAGSNQMAKMKMIAIGPTKVCIMDVDNHRVEEEHPLSSIEEVLLHGDRPKDMRVCEIVIKGSAARNLRLKSKKKIKWIDPELKIMICGCSAK